MTNIIRHVNSSTVSKSDNLSVSLSDAKTHLNVVLDDDDTYIRSIIDVATATVESMVKRSLSPSTYEAYYNVDGGIGVNNNSLSRLSFEVPGIPILSVTDLATQDNGLMYVSVPASEYVVQAYDHSCLVTMLGSHHLSFFGSVSGAYGYDRLVRITYEAGYDRDSIPAPIRHAILLMITHLFENREIVVTGTIVSSVPMGIQNLLMVYNYRRVSQ